VNVDRYGATPVKRRRRTQAELAEIDEAIVEAVAQDHPVSLRGVYYRVVSMGVIPKTETGYRTVGRELLKLRREGVVPYSHITDGTRWVSKPESWSDIDQMLADAGSSYRKALWHDQDAEVHVFTEKDAISGVLLPVTEGWDVPLGVLRGYASESFVHSVAEAVKDSPKQSVYLYQFGDDDPSGVDAWRSFREGVVGFLGEKVTPEMAKALKRYGVNCEVGSAVGVEEVDPDIEIAPMSIFLPDPEFDDRWDNTTTYQFLGGRHFHDNAVRRVTFSRLAVTPWQIETWGLPTRPTKKSDTRAKGFGRESVEVDAIPASRLREILEQAIRSHIDAERWNRLLEVEGAERESFMAFRDSWGRLAS
jgi:hypothetical protein